MARKPRIHFEGALYHVYSCGNAGQDIFIDDCDRRFFINTLLDIKNRLEMECHAYCLMTNHFHLLLEVGRVTVSRLMQTAFGRYAKHFNVRHKKFGHVFQGRPGAIPCLRDNYYMQLLRYIHLNPVEACMVQTIEDWPWSSHRAYAWGTPDPLVKTESALRLFDPDPETARGMYRKFVGAGNAPSFQLMTPLEAPKLDRPAVTRDLMPLARSVATNAGLTIDLLRSPTQLRRVTAARHQFVLDAWKLGFVPADIAGFLGQGRSAITEVIKRKSLESLNL